MKHLLPVLGLVGACSEFTVTPTPAPPVAEPPGRDPDPWGDAPDWTSCTTRFDGRYFNLPGGHPDLVDAADTGALGLDVVDDPDAVDWWDPSYAAFDRVEATLDMGGDWWPVDDGLAGDPQGFAARWLAWIRVTDSGPQPLRFSASTDAWLLVEGQVVAALSAQDGFAPQTLDVDLDSGQKRMELRFAHRGGESGLSFRPMSDDVAICMGASGDDTGG